MRQFLDVLFGRARPAPPTIERLFAMSTAQITLESQLNLRATNKAAISFRPVDSAFFEKLSVELDQLLMISTQDTGTKYESTTDRYGYRWVLLTDDQFEDLVATIHIISQTLIEHQFGEQLLTAIFRFDTSEGRPVYWLYNYKRGTFYPFAPIPGRRERDNALELRLSNAMERELPLEKQVERWYPVWDIPM